MPGELSNATAIEAFTAVLLQLNVRYKTRVAPKLTGIRDRGAELMRALTTRPAKRSCRSSPARSGHDVHVRHHAVRRDPPRSRRPSTCSTTCCSADCATSATTRKCVRNVTDVDDPLFAQGPRARRALPRPGGRRGGAVRRDMEALERAARCHRAAGVVGHPRHPRLHRHGARPRPRLSRPAASVYFDVVAFASLRRGRATTRDEQMLGSPRERGGNVDDPHKRHPLDFVLWQPSADDEPSWETMWGPGRPGLAHRVLGAGAARARHHHRPARRRHRPDLPAPRVRAGAERGGDRRAVRAPLDARRHGAHGRREDVEEPRQPGVRRCSSARTWDPRAIRLAIMRTPLPATVGVGRRARCRANARLERWLAVRCGPRTDRLDEVRAALDDDLDTPGALAAIDDASDRGRGRRRRRLLGVSCLI